MLQWPPDYDAELKRRIRNVQRLNTDARLRAGVMAHYRYNPVDWINDWCVTYDPRNQPPLSKVVPFMLFERQVEFVEFLYECFTHRESGLVEKARDMGASWVSCAFSVWLWIFWDSVAVGWGSRKEEYVDKKGDMKAIFPKMRLILDNLPVWMLPPPFSLPVHTPYMRILNPKTGSSITGEAGDNMGRGGRTSIYFKDESAHYERPELIEAALGDNTDVQIDISSVNGVGNVFYRRREFGQEWHRGHNIPTGIVRVFIFDWRHHPGKDQVWYDKRRAKAVGEGMLHVFKQEVERDYSGSRERVIIHAEWVKAAIDAHKVIPEKWGHPFPITGRKIAGQDIADGGGDKNGLIVRHGVLTFHAEHWAGEAGEAAEYGIPVCNGLGVDDIQYDSIGVGVGYKVQVNTMRKRPDWNKKLRITPWNAGGAPLDPDDNVIPGDPNSPLNKDQYANLKAQGWFRVRARFYKTFLAVTKGEYYPVDELISLDGSMPNVQQLVKELSQAEKKPNGEGKTVVDKKPDGTSSPNLADALIACYNPVVNSSIFDVL